MRLALQPQGLQGTRREQPPRATAGLPVRSLPAPQLGQLRSCWCGFRCSHCRRRSWGNCGTAGAVVAGAAAGADSAGVAGSTSSAAGVVAEVVAGRRPPELVVVMTGFVLFWTEVFFVDFFCRARSKGRSFWVFWLFVWFVFWIFGFFL